MSYTPPPIPARTTKHLALIEPTSQRAALTFEMRFTTIGTNSRALRIIEAIEQVWFPKDEAGVNQPVRPNDSLSAASLLAVLIPLTRSITFDFEVYDSAELRSFYWFVEWLRSDIFIDPSQCDEITEDVERLAAIWPTFEAVSNVMQNHWLAAQRAAQTRYPARPEMKIMSPEEEARLKQIDANFTQGG